MPRAKKKKALALLALLALLQVVAAVNIIYDEALWTKKNAYKVDFDAMDDFNPSDAFVQLRDALASSKYNSLDGPTPRRDVETLPT